MDTGPRPFYRAALASLAVSSALVLVIASAVRPSGSLPGPQRVMIAAALAALCLSAALGAGSLALRGRVRRPAWLDRVVAPRERAAVWLALAAWFPFVLVVAYYRARATFPPSEHWINFGYDDKRWEIAAYLLTVLAPMLFLTAAGRVLKTGSSHPPTWRAWFAGVFAWTGAAGSADATGAAGAAHAAGTAGSTDAVAREELPGERTTGHRWRGAAGRSLPVAAGLATALVLAWYFLGPPWYIDQSKALIGTQEEVFLVGFQAIAHGHLPYVGVAGVQYGPGTQLASYLLMRHVTSFSVVGFRQAWALFQWAGASILFAVFFLAFGYVRGLAVSLLSVLVYPALHQVAFQPGGTFDGFWAWANPLRYVGVVALVILLPAVIRRSPSWRGIAAGAGVGALWGVMSYMAQENLAAGAAGALVVGGLLLFSGTFSWRAVRAALLAALAGFLLIWLPILGFYAAHGDLGQFLNLYFLSPRAVAEGYSDSTWQGVSHKPSGLTTMFYALPFVLGIVALLAVFQFRPLRIATEWSRGRVLLVVTLLVTILLYQGVMLRADTAHLTGTLLAVPGLVVVAATEVPRLLGGRRQVIIAVGLALAAASFALLPYKAYAWSSVRANAVTPYHDRQRLAALPSPGQPATPAARRVGAALVGAPACCQGSHMSMPDFIRLMNRVHAIVGNRVTYVANVPYAYPGLFYFVADLTPAPVLFDKYTTILNESQLAGYMEYFRTNVLPQTQALLTDDLGTPEARFFVWRYPGARRITLHYGTKPIYLFVRRG